MRRFRHNPMELPHWLSATERDLMRFFEEHPEGAGVTAALHAISGSTRRNILRLQTEGLLVSYPSPGRENLIGVSRGLKLRSNGSDYYVWVVAPDGRPLAGEGPYGPHPLDKAKQMARIGAKQGAHDRAVSLGRSPTSDSFKLVRLYRRRTGERIL